MSISQKVDIDEKVWLTQALKESQNEVARLKLQLRHEQEQRISSLAQLQLQFRQLKERLQQQQQQLPESIQPLPRLVSRQAEPILQPPLPPPPPPSSSSSSSSPQPPPPLPPSPPPMLLSSSLEDVSTFLVGDSRGRGKMKRRGAGKSRASWYARRNNRGGQQTVTHYNSYNKI